MNPGSNERFGLPVALVIGGGGMGMSTARRLGQSRRVILASLTVDRNAEREAALREDGIDAVAVQCDITDPASVADLAGFVAARGPLGTLAHVAALSPSMGSWREILSVNLIGTTLMEQAIRPLASRNTAAIFVSSIAGHMVPPPPDDIVQILDDPLSPTFFDRLDALVENPTTLLAYSLSKFALNRMCRRRAVAWGRQGARILSMSPGQIATPMGAQTYKDYPQKYDMLRKCPAGREGTMTETADAIEFLASERASFITGTDILVDGGITAALQFPE